LLVDEFGDLLWVLPTVLDPAAIGRVDPEGRVLMDLPPMRPGQVGTDYPAELEALEEELRRHAMDLHEAAEGERCVLVGIREGSEEEERPRMEELGQLARSAFFDVVEIVMQHRERMDPRTLIGSGKVKDLSKTAVRVGATALLFDRELTGVQARNLEDRTGLQVLDRTEIVLRIFERRARTRAAKVRVALARLRYQLPRLVGKGEGMSRIARSGAAGMGTRGKGEPQLEMRRRQMRDRIHRLEALLGKVRKQIANRGRHRRRSGLPVVALVGYTNAGKSSWLNALTEARVLAEDLLFATLETTVRRTRLPGGRRILLSDTVGFLRDLPPGLMDAFRSTLEELAQADLLVHVVDLAERDWEDREKAVLETLKALGAEMVPRVTLFNKADLVDEDGMKPLLREHEGHFVSVKRREDRYFVRTWIEQALGLGTKNEAEDVS
jgi:GTP-binding protein HflX